MFTVDTHLSQRQASRDKPTENEGKSQNFEQEHKVRTLSSKWGQNLKPLQTLARNQTHSTAEGKKLSVI